MPPPGRRPYGPEAVTWVLFLLTSMGASLLPANFCSEKIGFKVVFPILSGDFSLDKFSFEVTIATLKKELQ
jgi:hypothetical protein